MNHDQLIQYIINPTLDTLKLNSKVARDLIIGTASQETNCGQYIHQIKGPALGIYQIEPKTFEDLWLNYISTRKADLIPLIRLASYCNQSLVIQRGETPKHQILIGNLFFSTAICRIYYLRVSEPLPSESEDKDKYINDLAHYYKKYYNTELGAATIPQIVTNFKKVIL